VNPRAAKNTKSTWASQPDARLLLVLSSERSGSTLLRVILGQHSRIVSPSELFLLRYSDYRTWREKKPVAIESMLELFELLGAPKTAAEVDAACAGLDTDAVYRWLWSFLPAQAILLDKTPAYANNPQTLRRSRSLDPFYVWLIRHPLAVIDSHTKLKRREREKRWAKDSSLRRRLYPPLDRALERLSRNMTALARKREAKWVQQQGNIRDFLATVPAGRHHVLHYEDLVSAPAPTVSRLCEAIGITAEPAMFEVDHRNRVMNPHLGDPNFHQHDAIDRHYAHGWKRRFSEQQLRPETIEMMRQIGVRSPLAAAASAATVGTGSETSPR
jgi:Sulfotransferase family